MYAVVDVETTGAAPAKSRVIEVAIVRFDGQQIVDQFSSLVHPECSIPEWISRLTGITNTMVQDAPKFYEVAKKIVELTNDCVFVAHNARFDYSFIKKEFAELGYTFRKDTLCTVALSRKLMPGLSSYRLGALTDHLQIEHTSKHRALGDTLATTELLSHLLQVNKAAASSKVVRSVIDRKLLPPNLDTDVVDQLPERTGVYYFYNEANEVIYVGKSNNIRTRVLSHLRPDHHSYKSVTFKNAIANIDYRETGSELMALLLEAAEIKRLHPQYNRMQQRSRFRYGLYARKNLNGVIELVVQANSDAIPPVLPVSSQRAAKTLLDRLAEEHQLCTKQLYPTLNMCLDGLLDPYCNGVCRGEEAVEIYNQRVTRLLSRYNYPYRDFIIVDRGRTADEKTVVAVAGNRLVAAGQLSIDDTVESIEQAVEKLPAYNETKDAKQIVLAQLRTKRGLRIVAKNSRALVNPMAEHYA